MNNQCEIRVILGICKSDHTWEEVEVRFDIDEDWESNLDPMNFNAVAFSHWIKPKIEDIKKLCGADSEKSRLINNLSNEISGCFTISWAWVDELEEKEG